MKELKEFRKSMNMTIEAFAKSIGISKSLYEKIENGVRGTSKGFTLKLKKKYPQFDTNIFFIS